MTVDRAQRLVRAACVLSLVALAFIVWSQLDPRPIPVIAAMSLGQVIGTVSFAAFLYVVVADLRARYGRRAPQRGEGPPDGPH